MPKENTFIIPYLGGKLIHRCLETLYKYTPNNFYCYVIDQSMEGLDVDLRDKYKNLMVIRTPRSDEHPTGNLGHSHASNLGIQLAQTPYVTLLNDDVEFVHLDWWKGVMDTFIKVEKASPSRPAIMVNAASIKLPDWSVGKPKGEDHYILPYKEEYTEEDWRSLIDEEHYVNEHLTITPGSVIDGINLYCTVVDTEKLLEIGLVDEFFYPGSANDYDICCRASMFGYRCVGTTLSWVFHHWSKTFENDELRNLMVQDELKHLDLKDKWGDRFDLWGVRCNKELHEEWWVDYHGNKVAEDSPKKHLHKVEDRKCDEIMHTDDGVKAVCPKHPDEVYAIPENTIAPL